MDKKKYTEEELTKRITRQTEYFIKIFNKEGMSSANKKQLLRNSQNIFNDFAKEMIERIY